MAGEDRKRVNGDTATPASWRRSFALRTRRDSPRARPIQTYDYEPHAGGTDFDDSNWPVIAPDSLKSNAARPDVFASIGTGLTLLIPERIGDFQTTGSTAVFETSLDDYAEVWVNGELPRNLGQSGGSVISGWNSPNRLVIGRELQPGQKIQLAVFGINGPISNPPTNFIWVR